MERLREDREQRNRVQHRLLIGQEIVVLVSRCLFIRREIRSRSPVVSLGGQRTYPLCFEMRNMTNLQNENTLFRWMIRVHVYTDNVVDGDAHPHASCHLEIVKVSIELRHRILRLHILVRVTDIIVQINVQ